jgi:hypothetical protein
MTMTEHICQAVTTQDGKLVLTMSEVPNHELNFMSGACAAPRGTRPALTTRQA